MREEAEAWGNLFKVTQLVQLTAAQTDMEAQVLNSRSLALSYVIIA